MVPQKTWVSENFGRISKSLSVFDKSRSLVFACYVFTFIRVSKLSAKESRARLFN